MKGASMEATSKRKLRPHEVETESYQHNNEPEYMPSRAMIWAECQRIQATWDDDERRRRRGELPPEPVVVSETTFMPEGGRGRQDDY